MRYSEEERAMWLEDWKQSGKSAWAYAKENDLNLQTFKSWIKAKTESPHYFVEIPAPVSQPAVYMPVHEIRIEKGDVTIRVPLSIGSGELRALMEGLGTAL